MNSEAIRAISVFQVKFNVEFTSQAVNFSIQPVIARTFERTVYNTFSKQNFEQYIRNDQFAYRTGGSCTNALLKIQHDIYQALDDPKIEGVRVFTMDFSKVFV